MFKLMDAMRHPVKPLCEMAKETRTSRFVGISKALDTLPVGCARHSAIGDAFQDDSLCFPPVRVMIDDLLPR